jgi:hypothetical protein
MYVAAMGNKDFAGIERNGVSLGRALILAHSRNDDPGVLPGGMHMRGDALAWLYVPSDHRSVRRLRDHRANGFALRGLQEVRDQEAAYWAHGVLRKSVPPTFKRRAYPDGLRTHNV